MSTNVRFIAIAAIVLGSVFSCKISKSPKENTRKVLPNFVLLMGDDHGWDEVGYNGHQFVKTPVLDQMAAEGLRFDRFYSAHPTCSPTRGSFVTGRHPNRYGTFTPGYSIRPEEITIAHILKEAGYLSAHFGKWHIGPVKKESLTNPGAMGFDEWFSHDNFFELDPVLSRNGETPQKIKGEGSEIIIDAAIEFIKKSQNQGKPFLTVIWFGSPHEPYSGLPEDLALYDNLPDSLSNVEVRLTSNETGLQVNRPLRDVLRERYAEITAMDRAIGKLRDYLKKNNLKENTFVFYCGDNGTPPDANRTGMTLRGEKGFLYEGGVRVPGVLEWPAGIDGPTSTSLISVTSDLLPTLAEIAGQALPQRPLDGISLVPYLNDPDKQRATPLCFWRFEPWKVYDGKAQSNYIDPKLQEGTTPLAKKLGGSFTRNFHNQRYSEISKNDTIGQRSILKGNFKLLIEGQSPNDAGCELYNLQDDPGEMENLADKFPEVVKDLKAELLSWQRSVLESLAEKDYPE